MQLKRHNIILAGFSLLFIALSCYLIWLDQVYLSLAIPLGLLSIFFAVYYTEYAFLALAFLTPLSVNIEEYTDSFGLFIPTEPLLFGLLLLLIMNQLKGNIILPSVKSHPIVIAISIYLLWLLITSITSEHPVTSFKFLLAKLWFIVPLVIFGPLVFVKLRNIRLFIWLFCGAMIIAVLYTLFIHAQYSFGEKEGHWVMWPFFKDHTIYGALVAFIVPLVFGLYFSKKHSPLVQAVILGMIGITLVGLYFSYTRAAWLSIFAAIGVLFAIKLKIHIKWLAGAVILGGIWLLFSWEGIQQELERNKFEHTTEEFGEKLQSATNVTTDASNLERLNRWACAMDMFRERPVFGFGPGTYAFEYARFQDPENLTIISTNFGNLGNAHSEYLGPLSETGLIGLLSVIIMIGVLFYKGITLYLKWPDQDKETRTLLLAMILALVTYFIHGIINNYLDTDKAAVPIWSFAAMFIALEYKLKFEILKKKEG